MSDIIIPVWLLPLVLLMFCSCDEGRIYDEDVVAVEKGGIVRFRAGLTGPESWTEDYTLAVAGFADDSEYALISKNVESAITADGRCDLIMTGIPENVSSIELCALDRLRRRVAVFASAAYRVSPDTVFIDSETVNVSMAHAIQQEILNTTCVQCHGRSNFVAAGLDLTEAKSFASLVAVPSVKMSGLNRIEPGRSDRSVFYMILSGDCSSSWSYDHSVEVVRQEKLELIKNWIDGGADPR